MKKLVMLIVIGILTLSVSCRKKDQNCNCGELEEIFSYVVDGTPQGFPFIKYESKDKYIIKNLCTGKEREFNEDELTRKGLLYCDIKGKSW